MFTLNSITLPMDLSSTPSWRTGTLLRNSKGETQKIKHQKRKGRGRSERLQKQMTILKHTFLEETQTCQKRQILWTKLKTPSRKPPDPGSGNSSELNKIHPRKQTKSWSRKLPHWKKCRSCTETQNKKTDKNRRQNRISNHLSNQIWKKRGKKKGKWTVSEKRV